jgi:EmrB/QacA subfamily drug resistance transporter
VPIGIVAALCALWALPSDAPEPSESFDVVGMLLMSPGLALFLYGISSIPGEGTVMSTKVLVPLGIGLAMLVAFVFYSFRPKHPLLDLRLFRNRRLSVATITMFLFAAAFFGGLLLVPTYLQQVRGLDTLHAAFLMVPQGLGAMVTMPIAGALSDRIPVGRIVPFGLLAITGGMFALTQVGVDTPYWGFLVPVLFVMGLGMGGTMMPLMTSALKTLQSHQVARGSTLLNITQQIASSVGVAVISVVFTNYLSAAALAGPAIAALHDPTLVDDVGGPAAVQEGLVQAADAFGSTFLVAAILVALTLIPASFLPRKREESHFLDDQAEAAQVIVH